MSVNASFFIELMGMALLSSGSSSNKIERARLKTQSTESGQATVLVALFMGLVVLGLLALALDVGYFFHEKRMAQAAADAAAVAAAEELTANNAIGSANVVNAANTAATLNGFDTTLATNPAQVTLSPLPNGNYSSAGSGAAPTSWVRATVTMPIPTFFLGAFNHQLRTLNVSASAVAAGGAPSPTCICLTGGSGTDLNMSNNAQLTASQCGIEANSNSNGNPNAISIVGGASVCGTSVQAVASNWIGSSMSNNGSICSAATKTQSAAPCSNNLSAPAMPPGLAGHCTDSPIQGYDLAPNSLNPNNNNGNYSLPFNGAQKMSNGQPVPIPNDTVINNSVCYTNFNLAGAAQVVFAPGTYYINGDFTTGGGEKISGTGVTFVVSGAINIANSTTTTLSAPTLSGAPGVLFYVTGSSGVNIQGGSGSSIAGIIDAPNSAMTLANGTNTTTNMDIVANTLTMAGGATLNSYATPAMGGSSGGSGIARLTQ